MRVLCVCANVIFFLCPSEAVSEAAGGSVSDSPCVFTARLLQDWMDGPGLPPCPSTCPVSCLINLLFLCARACVCVCACVCLYVLLCGNGYRWHYSTTLAVWIITHTDRERPRAEEPLTSSTFLHRRTHSHMHVHSHTHIHISPGYSFLRRVPGISPYPPPPLLRDWSVGFPLGGWGVRDGFRLSFIFFVCALCSLPLHFS